MPSASTRLTLTFLYSFPSIVLKSSASAIYAEQTIKIATLRGVDSIAAMLIETVALMRDNLFGVERKPEMHAHEVRPGK